VPTQFLYLSDENNGVRRPYNGLARHEAAQACLPKWTIHACDDHHNRAAALRAIGPNAGSPDPI
jgi:hypothetical protein